MVYTCSEREEKREGMRRVEGGRERETDREGGVNERSGKGGERSEGREGDRGRGRKLTFSWASLIVRIPFLIVCLRIFRPFG